MDDILIRMQSNKDKWRGYIIVNKRGKWWRRASKMNENTCACTSCQMFNEYRKLLLDDNPLRINL